MSLLGDFKKFLLRGNVVDLAVAALTDATLLFVKGVDLLAVRQAGAVVERELSYTPGTRLARR